MKILRVEAGKAPMTINIEDTLENLQEQVEGSIEVIYPFDDPVGLVCNEESKLIGMSLNRALCGEDGRVYDVIAGPFLIVGLGEESFDSLSDELLDKYEKIFHSPEMFVRTGNGIGIIRMPDTAA